MTLLRRYRLTVAFLALFLVVILVLGGWAATAVAVLFTAVAATRIGG